VTSETGPAAPRPVIIGQLFGEFIRHIEREKFRVLRDSGAHALFLLVGKTRYQRMIGVFYASHSRRYVPAIEDDRATLCAILGLTIVIDPSHADRLEVIGPVFWEAFR